MWRKILIETRIHADQLSNSGAAKLAAELEAATAITWKRPTSKGSRHECWNVNRFAAGLSLCARDRLAIRGRREMIEAGLGS